MSPSPFPQTVVPARNTPCTWHAQSACPTCDPTCICFEYSREGCPAHACVVCGDSMYCSQGYISENTIRLADGHLQGRVCTECWFRWAEMQPCVDCGILMRDVRGSWFGCASSGYTCGKCAGSEDVCVDYDTDSQILDSDPLGVDAELISF